MSIRLITFDLDNTLWDVTPVMQSAEASLRAWLGEHAPLLGAVPIEHLWAIRARLLSDEPALKYRLSELRRRILLLALQEAGYPAQQAGPLAEAGFQTFMSARHQVTLFADVHATLAQLAKQYQLAVITNGNADVRRLGLAEYFTFTLCAEELGIGKPDPLPFQRALANAQVRAEQAVHIGDHHEDDIAGAHAAGLRSVWFNPAAKDWLGGERAHGEIRHLSQLPALLADWH